MQSLFTVSSQETYWNWWNYFQEEMKNDLTQAHNLKINWILPMQVQKTNRYAQT